MYRFFKRGDQVGSKAFRRNIRCVISDGVVTFDSANLQYAKQTLILRGAGHGGVVSDSRAIAWIINLLEE